MQNKFKFTTLTVDLTSKSHVYDTLGPVSNWLNHRFGSRSIDESIELSTLTALINSSSQLRLVILQSVFGDPVCYDHIQELCDLCDLKKIKLVIDTYGMGELTTFNTFNCVDATVNVCVSNVVNSEDDAVFLNSEWSSIKQNTAVLGQKATVNFELFKHNNHQLPLAQQYSQETGCKIKINNGRLNAANISCIIDSNGKWLYDLHPNEYQGPTKVKTMDGWHNLKHYSRPPSSPMEISYSRKIPSEIIESDKIWVCANGAIFDNHTDYFIFSNIALATLPVDIQSLPLRDDKLSIRTAIKKLVSRKQIYRV